MSVRAYRVKKIEYEKNPSFNLWEDTELADFFLDHADCWDGRNVDGIGMIELPARVLAEAIKRRKEFKIDEYALKYLKADYKWAKEKGGGFISYTCF